MIVTPHLPVGPEEEINLKDPTGRRSNEAYLADLKSMQIELSKIGEQWQLWEIHELIRESQGHLERSKT